MRKAVSRVLILCMLLSMTIRAAAHGSRQDQGGELPYADWPVIASIERAGNDSDESVEFTLTGCTAMRLYALGEGSQWGMDDYGSIERADTGQVVWQMHLFETTPDGWLTNRRVDRPISLPAGDYRLRFRSNGSHAFDDWGQKPPENRFWGIALYKDIAADRPAPTCWAYADKPEALGWSSRRLERLGPMLEQLNVAALMVVTDGQVVYEWGNTANNFRAHSMRKSLLSALYGIAVAEGAIDPFKTMAELGIDDKTPLTEMERQATVADLLKARSGIYIPAAGEAASMKALRPQRGSHAPGTFWYYNNWDFNTLGTIYDQASGEPNIYAAFQRRIAEPLGMQDLDIAALSYAYEPSSMHPYYGFRISARDLARFGQLYLQHGAWQGKPIVPTDWVRKSSIPHSLTGDAGTYSGYGHMWWVAAEDCWGIETGAYAASGFGGQTVQVLPQINSVIVVRVNTDDGESRLGSDQVDVLISKLLIASNRVQEPDRASGQCAAQCPAQGAAPGAWTSKSCGYQAYYTEMVTLPAAGWIMPAWGVGVAVSLIALIELLSRRATASWAAGIVWILVVLVFGPLGLVAYWATGRASKQPSIWLAALSASLRCATGNTIGLIALIVIFATFVRSGNVGPLALVVPFVVGWTAFRAPLLAQRAGSSYGSALRRTWFTELMTTCLSLAGIAPLAIVLENRWHPWAQQLDSPLFWLSYLAAAFAGAVLVYPLNLWLVRRGFESEPSGALGRVPPPLPSLGTAWGALAISLTVLAAAIAVIA